MRVRWAIGAAMALGLLLLVATVRQIREGGRASAESDAALARADTATAIARARAAAEALAPGSPYPARGYARLEAIARDAEVHGDEATATAAWRAMRAAALETRAAGADADGWRRLGDEGLARVGSGAGPWVGGVGAGAGMRAGAAASSEVRATEPVLRAALARDDTPPTWRFALLAAAAASFFGGTARLAWIGADAAAVKRARLAASAAALGLALYVLACLQG
jgi:hypothetical protein